MGLPRSYSNYFWEGRAALISASLGMALSSQRTKATGHVSVSVSLLSQANT